MHLPGRSWTFLKVFFTTSWQIKPSTEGQDTLHKTVAAFSPLLLSPACTSTLTWLAIEVSRGTHKSAVGLLELSVEEMGHHKGTVGWKVNKESCA